MKRKLEFKRDTSKIVLVHLFILKFNGKLKIKVHVREPLLLCIKIVLRVILTTKIDQLGTYIVGYLIKDEEFLYFITVIRCSGGNETNHKVTVRNLEKKLCNMC